MAVKSRNQMVVVGTIIETNVKYSPDEKSIFDDKIKGAFVKDDFKNPMFRIEVAENEEKMISHAIVDVDMYSIFKQRTKKDSDELIDNETFKALANLFDYDDVHDEWNFDTAIGKRIKISGSLVENMYAKDEEIKRFNQIQGSYVETNPTKIPDFDYAEVKLSGYINKIVDETVGEDETPTGRKKVQFLYVTTPKNELTGNFLDLIVPADIVDGFEEELGEGDNANIDVEIVTVTVGGKTESKKGFGKKASHVVGGFTTTEYRIFDGSEIEEPDEDDTNSKFLTDKDIRKAKQMRKTVAEAKIKKAKEKASEKASEGSSKGLGKYKKSSVDDADMPVDDEDPFFN